MVETRTVPLESLDDSSDDEPLIVLVKKKPQHIEHNGTQGEKDQNRQPEPESKNSTRKDSGLDDTSDDEPMTKMLNKLSRAKEATVQAKRPATTGIQRGTGNGIKKTNNRFTGSTQNEDSYDSSDDEPLIKMARKIPKQTSLPFKKRPFNTAREVNDVKKRRNSSQNTNKISTDSSSGDSSDDVPLINMVDKLKTQMRTKTPTTKARKTPGIKKPRKVLQKHNRSIETSDDSSDDEPLINLTKKSPSKETERTILKRCVTKESNSNNCNKIEGKMSREEEVSSDSDDKPLINLVKKPLKAVKKTTTPLKKRSVSGKTVVARKKTRPDIMNKAVIRRSTKVVQRTREGSLDDSSDDEPLSKKMVRNPQMKSLMVILERCDTKEVLEDNYRANVENTGKRSAGDKENSDDELLIKMVTNPPHSSPETMAEKENKSQTALTMNL
uniref:nucleolar and coiled-body phosphoprotein 1-like isoform X1 n=2 Tax=Oncorhynchus gorbuscha TaxID=8017 RepID=UPI001EAF85D6|nr:nucleolar and coiled-body phosphoprotein 1-like isoform X1 [Oncorhynchus gorbuscha]XP_046182651.1 nucleolar and coiled-body phosphoprotein 1-like isoform X1 [Oncorhynchus gorbuscha]XP_046182652.1 nucleolar and coiled-body phosphoprotein 1-like isoform X1 [Oncorhynchus gorbuscha]